MYGIHPVYLALLQKKRNTFQLFLRTSNEESWANGNTKRKEEIESIARAQGVQICNVDSKGMKYLAPGVVHQVNRNNFIYSLVGSSIFFPLLITSFLSQCVPFCVLFFKFN